MQQDLLVDCEKEAGSNLRGLRLPMSIRLLLLEYTKYYKRHFGVWDIQRFSERNYFLRVFVTASYHHHPLQAVFKLKGLFLLILYHQLQAASLLTENRLCQ
jgi:hypothetical protein